MKTSIEPAAISVNDYCAAYRISRDLFYKQVKAGNIKIVKAGRRTLVPVSELSAWPARLAGK
jgi:hypothetical protein